MTRTVQAVYENGVLRPLEPVNLAENAKVTVTIADGSETVPDEASFDSEFHGEASTTKPPETAGQRKPLAGRLAHLNLKTPTLEEFKEARREMWANFPREFPTK
jgi:predicted DNA-binding antitoxin AbrB/MazE fold protein